MTAHSAFALLASGFLCDGTTEPLAPLTLALSGPTSAQASVTDGFGSCNLPLTVSTTGGSDASWAGGTITWTGVASKVSTTESVAAATLGEWFQGAALSPGKNLIAQRTVTRERAFKVRHDLRYTTAGEEKSASHEFTCDFAPVAALVPTATSVSLLKGATSQLTVVLKDSVGSALSGRRVAWASSKTDVATVNPSGVLTAVAPGTATITVTSEEKAATVTATVLAPVASVAVNPSARSLPVGGTSQLTAIARDSAGGALNGRAVLWTSDKPAIVTVDTLGLIRGVAVGSARITASVETRTGTADVVVGPPVATIAIAPAPATVSAGLTTFLRAILRSSSGDTLTGRTVTWASDSVAIATVDTVGVVTGVSLGTTTIRAMAEGKTATATITVRKPVASVSLSATAAKVSVGRTVTIAAELKDADGISLTNREITWTSSDTTIARVNGQGLVSGIKSGTASVSAASEGKVASAAIEVVVPVASVAITPTTVTVPAGLTATLIVILKDSAGNALTGRSVAWSSAHPAVASVDSAGVITGVVAGSTTVTASLDGKTATASVTVIPGVASVVVDPAADSVQVGDFIELRATAKDAAGTVMSRSITWSSASSATATVDSAGIVTGVAVGKVTVTARSETRTAAAQITVLPRAPISQIEVLEAPAYVPVGATRTLAVKVTDAAGMRLRGRPITWTSSSAAVATVSELGVVTGVALGTVTIKGSAEGKAAEISIQVVPPAATVTVTPVVDTLPVGATVTKIATVKDASGAVLTGREIAWTSSSPSVATVSQTGVVTAHAVGTSGISVAVEGKTATAGVLVVPPIASIKLEPNPARVSLGLTAQLSAVPLDASGNALSGRKIVWTTSNAQVATVSTTGVVTGVALGTAEITATSEGKSTARTVTVSKPVASVALSPTTALLGTGKTVTLAPTIKDASGVVLLGGTIAWSSSNTSVATVSSAGVVTGVSTGAATITATIEGKSASAAVSVFTSVALIDLSFSTVRLRLGATTTITAITKDAAGATLTGRALTWSSSDPLVASVTSAGVITAHKSGSVSITATSEGVTKSASVSAFIPLVAVLMDPLPGPLTKGATAQLKAYPLTIEGDTATDRGTPTWSSSDPTIATVSATGSVTGLKVGSAVISAIVEEAYGVITVSVNPPPGGETPTSSISSITISPGSITVPWLQKVTAAATVKDVAGQTVTDQIPAWGSSDASVVKVLGPGLLEGIKVGSATISVSLDGKTATAIATVPAVGPTAKILLYAAPKLVVGQKEYAHAQILDANGVDLVNVQKSASYSSSNPAVLQVDGSGNMTAMSVGSANVVATSDGKTATAGVQVFASGTLGAMTVTPAIVSVFVGLTTRLEAVLRDVAGNGVTGTYAWTTSDPSIATVSSNGTVTGIKAGVATISVTALGVSGSAQVHVGRSPITQFAVNPPYNSITVGATTQFTATAGISLSDRVVTWSSDYPAIASVSNTGLVTGKAIGNATICAAAEGQNDCSFIHVVNVLPPVTRIEIVGANLNGGIVWTSMQYPWVDTLEARAYDATGFQIFHHTATWSSSKPQVMSVSNQGVITHNAPGFARIKAVMGGMTQELPVYVDIFPLERLDILGYNKLSVGETSRFSIRPFDGGGNLLSTDHRAFVWSSTNPAVATVSALGVVTARSVGVTTLTATSEEGPSATYLLTVVSVADEVVSLSVTPAIDTIEVDSTAILVGRYQTATGETIFGKGILWTSSDSTIASVPSEGTYFEWISVPVAAVRGRRAGVVTITGKIGTKSVSATIRVVSPIPVASVIVEPNPLTIELGATENLGAGVRDASGNYLLRKVVWSSSNASIASVDEYGRVFGKALGTATVTASAEGKSGSATVSVVAALPKVATVTVSPNPSSVRAGETVKLIATARDATGTLLTGRPVTWFSNNTAVATVGATGIVTGEVSGTAKISATVGGITGSSSLTVNGVKYCSSTIEITTPGRNATSSWHFLGFPKNLEVQAHHSYNALAGVSTYYLRFRNNYSQTIYFSGAGPSGTMPSSTQFAMSVPSGEIRSAYAYPSNPPKLYFKLDYVRLGSDGGPIYCEAR